MPAQRALLSDSRIRDRGFSLGSGSQGPRSSLRRSLHACWCRREHVQRLGVAENTPFSLGGRERQLLNPDPPTLANFPFLRSFPAVTFDTSRLAKPVLVCRFLTDSHSLAHCHSFGNTAAVSPRIA